MAVRVASEIHGIVGMLLAIGSSAIVPATIAGLIAVVGNASWPLVTLIGVSGYVLAFMGMLFLLPLTPAIKKRVKDKELKQHYFQLSESLLQFADERDENAPPNVTPQFNGGLIGAILQAASDPQNQERTAYEDETRNQYSKRYGSRVGELLDVAEERGWIHSEERRRLEEDIKATFRLQEPTAYIREVAQHLERFGRKL